MESAALDESRLQLTGRFSLRDHSERPPDDPPSPTVRMKDVPGGVQMRILTKVDAGAGRWNVTAQAWAGGGRVAPPVPRRKMTFVAKRKINSGPVDRRRM